MSLAEVVVVREQGVDDVGVWLMLKGREKGKREGRVE